MVFIFISLYFHVFWRHFSRFSKIPIKVHFYCFPNPVERFLNALRAPARALALVRVPNSRAQLPTRACPTRGGPTRVPNWRGPTRACRTRVPNSCVPNSRGPTRGALLACPNSCVPNSRGPTRGPQLVRAQLAGPNSCVPNSRVQHRHANMKSVYNYCVCLIASLNHYRSLPKNFFVWCSP